MQSASLSTAGKANTSPHRSASGRTPLGEMGPDCNGVTHTAPKEDYLPAPTPGQPRKTPRIAASPERHHPYQRPSNSGNGSSASLEAETREAEIMSVHLRGQGDETDEEWHLRMRMHRKASAQASPERVDKSSRSGGRTTKTTTTTTVYQIIDNDATNDVENVGAANPRASKRSVSGTMTKARHASNSAGVRKASGRIGSVGSVSATATSAIRRLSGQNMI